MRGVRGGPRIFMKGKGEVANDQTYFPGIDVFFLQFLQGIFVEFFAKRAFVVGELDQRDRGFQISQNGATQGCHIFGLLGTGVFLGSCGESLFLDLAQLFFDGS